MPYLIGPNSAEMTPNMKRATNSDGRGLQREARDRDGRRAEFRQFEPLRDQGLVEAVGHFAAEAGKEEEGQDEDAAGQRH